MQSNIASKFQWLFQAILVLHQNDQRQIQDLESKVNDLEAERQLLLRTVQNSQDKIAELQCLPYPYSLDGDAICNFD